MNDRALQPPSGSALERGCKIAFICALHGLLLYMLATPGVRAPGRDDLLRVDVRLIEERPLPRAEPEPPRRPIPRPLSTPPVVPLPVLTAAPDAPATATGFTVAPQPPLPMRPEAAPQERPVTPAVGAAPPPVLPARFNADYLHNPAPVYPLMSRRSAQQGRVLLRVLVSRQGTASAIEIQSGSGHPRLDQAALDAVRQWRFVPARRGTETIEDWVVVPIEFRLD